MCSCRQYHTIGKHCSWSQKTATHTMSSEHFFCGRWVVAGFLSWEVWSWLLSMQGNVKQAEVELQTATQLSPNHALAHLELGNVYERTGDRQRAAVEFQTALELNGTLTIAKQKFIWVHCMHWFILYAFIGNPFWLMPTIQSRQTRNPQGSILEQARSTTINKVACSFHGKHRKGSCKHAILYGFYF